MGKEKDLDRNCQARVQRDDNDKQYLRCLRVRRRDDRISATTLVVCQEGVLISKLTDCGTKTRRKAQSPLPRKHS
jgi:hypothetical protein